MGRVTADPVRHTRPGRAPYVGFGFVVNDRVRTQSGEWRDVPMFIDCEAHDALGEHVLAIARKGYLLLLEGRLRLDEWADKDNVRHRKHVFVLHDARVMEKPKGAYQPPAPAAAKISEPVVPADEPEII